MALLQHCKCWLPSSASGKSLEALASGFNPLPQVLVNVRIKKGFDLSAYPAIGEACRAC
jgi:hypothetical protein